MDVFEWLLLMGLILFTCGFLWALFEKAITLFPVLLMVYGMLLYLIPPTLEYGAQAIFRKSITEKADLSQIPLKGIRDCSVTVDLKVRYVDGEAQPGTFVVKTPVVCEAVEAEVKKSTE